MDRPLFEVDKKNAGLYGKPSPFKKCKGKLW